MPSPNQTPPMVDCDPTSTIGDWVTVSQRALRALEATDAMPARLRECVHEFGYEIVSVISQAGIIDPGKIRAIVHTVWNGAREPIQRTGTKRRAHPSPVLGHLDWLLIQAGAPITARTLIRGLDMHGMVIVPREPSTVMVQASMDATNQMGVVSKAEKHKGRLRAAIRASTQRLWPHLFEPGKLDGSRQPDLERRGPSPISPR